MRWLTVMRQSTLCLDTCHGLGTEGGGGRDPKNVESNGIAKEPNIRSCNGAISDIQPCSTQIMFHEPKAEGRLVIQYLGCRFPVNSADFWLRLRKSCGKADRGRLAGQRREFKLHRKSTAQFNTYNTVALYILWFFTGLAPCRQPHPQCDAPPQPDDDAYNLLPTTGTNLEEGDEVHYACKNASYAIESTNPNLASGGSFVLGRTLSMLNE